MSDEWSLSLPLVVVAGHSHSVFAGPPVVAERSSRHYCHRHRIPPVAEGKGGTGTVVSSCRCLVYCFARGDRVCDCHGGSGVVRSGKQSRKRRLETFRGNFDSTHSTLTEPQKSSCTILSINRSSVGMVESRSTGTTCSTGTWWPATLNSQHVNLLTCTCM